MKKYDTIIFDLDGTLLNSLEDLQDSLNYLMTKNGYKTRTLEEVRSFVGDGVKMLIKRATPDTCTAEDIDLYFEDFTAHYDKNMQNKTRPYDGIMELLMELDRYNYKMAVVSNKYDQAVKYLVKYYFKDLIPVAIGECPSVKRKPCPDSLYAAVDKLDSSLDKTIYVGDSDTDMKTAENAGVTSVGVTWGFRTREVLNKAGADYIIDTPKELLTLI